MQLMQQMFSGDPDLIDTLWNVKGSGDPPSYKRPGDLIDTLWNVKEGGKQ